MNIGIRGVLEHVIKFTGANEHVKPVLPTVVFRQQHIGEHSHYAETSQQKRLPNNHVLQPFSTEPLIKS